MTDFKVVCSRATVVNAPSESNVTGLTVPYVPNSVATHNPVNLQDAGVAQYAEQVHDLLSNRVSVKIAYFKHDNLSGVDNLPRSNGRMIKPSASIELYGNVYFVMQGTFIPLYKEKDGDYGEGAIVGVVFGGNFNELYQCLYGALSKIANDAGRHCAPFFKGTNVVMSNEEWTEVDNAITRTFTKKDGQIVPATVVKIKEMDVDYKGNLRLVGQAIHSKEDFFALGDDGIDDVFYENSGGDRVNFLVRPYAFTVDEGRGDSYVGLTFYLCNADTKSFSQMLKTKKGTAPLFVDTPNDKRDMIAGRDEMVLTSIMTPKDDGKYDILKLSSVTTSKPSQTTATNAPKVRRRIFPVSAPFETDGEVVKVSKGHMLAGEDDGIERSQNIEALTSSTPLKKKPKRQLK